MEKFFYYFYDNLIKGNFDLLGFLGAIIGVIGAYFVASYGFRKQRKIEKNYALDMLCCLLNSTIAETEYVIDIFIDKCKYYWESKVYEEYLKNIKDYHLKEEAKIFISNVEKDFYTNESSLCLFQNVMSQPRFGNLINNFNNDVNESFDFDGLIYDENWYSHLKFIDDKEKLYRKSIINWIRLIDNTIIEIPNDKDIEGRYLDISKFINLRDEIIQFLKLHGYKSNKLYKEIYNEKIRNVG